jgi:hypothetical protein
MQEFIALALPKLTAVQFGEIGVLLLEVLEGVMSVMDDAMLPAAYHAAFQDRTREPLSMLRHGQAAED